MRTFLSIVVAAFLSLGCAHAQQIPQYSLIPGSALSAMTGLPAGYNPYQYWSSFLWKPDRNELCAIRAGGHADWGGANSECYDFDTPERGWYPVEPVQPLVIDTAISTCKLPANGPGSVHIYDGLEYLGDNKAIFTGATQYCPQGMNFDPVVYVVDMDTWAWTKLTHLTAPSFSIYFRYARIAVDGDFVYVTPGDAKALILSRSTLQPVSFGGSNINMESGGSAMGISAGIACVNDKSKMWCSKVDGASSSFRTFVARASGINPAANACMAQIRGENSMTPRPGGGFTISHGDKKLIRFTPGAGNDPALDTCEVINSPTGPELPAVNGLYSKAFYRGDKLFMTSSMAGIWEYSDAGAPPVDPPVDPEEPPVEPTNNKLVCEVVYQGELPTTFSLDCERQEAQAPPPVDPPDEPDPPVPPVSGDYGLPPTATLAQLAALPGTLLADPLDNTPISGPGIAANAPCLTISQTISNCRYGWWRDTWKTTTPTPPVVDPTAGDGGALKFTIASQSGQGGAGLYTVNLSPDSSVGVGVGEILRIRLQQKADCQVYFTDCNPASQAYKQERRHYDTTQGPGGIKFFSVGQIDTNLTAGGFAPNEANYMNSGEGVGTPVWSNYMQRGFMAGYIAVWYEPIEQAGAIINGITQRDLQPGGDDVCWQNDPSTGFGLTAAWPTCHMMPSDEWVTIQMDLYFGGCRNTPPGKNDVRESHVKLWIADEGKPFDLVVDRAISLRCSNIPDPKLGKVWLTPYNSFKNPSEVHPEGHVWYDSLWVAKVD